MTIDDLYAFLTRRGIADHIAHRAAGAVVALQQVKTDVERMKPSDPLDRITRDLTVLTWMVGVNIGLTVLVLAKVM